MNQELHQRCGSVAFLGLANAGKSTLLNALMERDLAAVSPKPQTTRFAIRGVFTRQNAQVIFVDTPGLMKEVKGSLKRSMQREALETASQADVVCLVIDVTRAQSQLDNILSHFKSQGERGQKKKASLWVILNKIDQVKKETLLAWASLYRKEADRIFMISALTRDGVDDLLAHLCREMPGNPWLFERETQTTLSTRIWAAEVTREVLLKQLDKEVPHHLYVETESFEEDERGLLKIGQVIHVMDQGHKKIILGRAGKRIKAVGIMAREVLEKRLGRKKIYLTLYVRVSEDWTEKPDYYRLHGVGES